MFHFWVEEHWSSRKHYLYVCGTQASIKARLIAIFWQVSLEQTKMKHTLGAGLQEPHVKKTDKQCFHARRAHTEVRSDFSTSLSSTSPTLKGTICLPYLSCISVHHRAALNQPFFTSTLSCVLAHKSDAPISTKKAGVRIYLQPWREEITENLAKEVQKIQFILIHPKSPKSLFFCPPKRYKDLWFNPSTVPKTLCFSPTLRHRQPTS